MLHFTHTWPRRSVHNLWLCRRDRCTHFLFCVGFLFFFSHSLDSHAWSSFGRCRYWPDAPTQNNRKNEQTQFDCGFVPQWLEMTKLFVCMFKCSIYMTSVSFVHPPPTPRPFVCLRQAFSHNINMKPLLLDHLLKKATRYQACIDNVNRDDTLSDFVLFVNQTEIVATAHAPTGGNLPACCCLRGLSRYLTVLFPFSSCTSTVQGFVDGINKD